MKETEKYANVNVYARHEGELLALRIMIGRVTDTIWDAMDEPTVPNPHFPYQLIVVRRNPAT